MAQGSYGMLILGDTENSTDQCPQQPALKLKLPDFERGLDQMTS